VQARARMCVCVCVIMLIEKKTEIIREQHNANETDEKMLHAKQKKNYKFVFPLNQIFSTFFE